VAGPARAVACPARAVLAAEDANGREDVAVVADAWRGLVMPFKAPRGALRE
jgi:hypothetical protein